MSTVRYQTIEDVARTPPAGERGMPYLDTLWDGIVAIAKELLAQRARLEPTKRREIIPKIMTPNYSDSPKPPTRKRLRRKRRATPKRETSAAAFAAALRSLRRKEIA